MVLFVCNFIENELIRGSFCAERQRKIVQRKREENEAPRCAVCVWCVWNEMKEEEDRPWSMNRKFIAACLIISVHIIELIVTDFDKMARYGRPHMDTYTPTTALVVEWHVSFFSSSSSSLHYFGTLCFVLFCMRDEMKIRPVEVATEQQQREQMKRASLFRSFDFCHSFLYSLHACALCYLMKVNSLQKSKSRA